MTLNLHHQQAITLLADAYQKDFCQYISDNEQFIEVVTELAAMYVEERIPIVNAEATIELSVQLAEGVCAN